MHQSSVPLEQETANTFNFPVDFDQLIMPAWDTRWKGRAIIQLLGNKCHDGLAMSAVASGDKSL